LVGGFENLFLEFDGAKLKLLKRRRVFLFLRQRTLATMDDMFSFLGWCSWNACASEEEERGERWRGRRRKRSISFRAIALCVREREKEKQQPASSSDARVLQLSRSFTKRRRR
jgi:hypothetical protein